MTQAGCFKSVPLILNLGATLDNLTKVYYLQRVSFIIDPELLWRYTHLLLSWLYSKNRRIASEENGNETERTNWELRSKRDHHSVPGVNLWIAWCYLLRSDKQSIPGLTFWEGLNFTANIQVWNFSEWMRSEVNWVGSILS